MLISLEGRNAIITGGSRGIGLAIAHRFSASGANVLIVARDKNTLESARDNLSATAKGRVEIFAGDVATADGVNNAHAYARDVLGTVDILVNNAGISRKGDFETVTDEIWQADLDLKLFAAIRFARLVWPQMKTNRWGRIINILSVKAKLPEGGTAPTSVTRAAGLALTKVLAGEGAPHNILVNALLVGVIQTPQFEHLWSHPAHAEQMRKITERLPLGRFGKPDELASLACFLASEQASFINGASINVDGGELAAL